MVKMMRRIIHWDGTPKFCLFYKSFKMKGVDRELYMSKFRKIDMELKKREITDDDPDLQFNVDMIDGFENGEYEVRFYIFFK